MATTNIADRLINITQAAFADIGDGYGLAEGGLGMGAGMSVVSGNDHRSDNQPYVNQIFIAQAGGPGSPTADGWPNYTLPVVSGLMYRDAVEIDELKHPFEFRYIRMMPGTGGAGKFRGAPAIETAFAAKQNPIEAIWPCDGTHFPPKGVRGGRDGLNARHWKVSANGLEEELPNVAHVTIGPGELIRGNSTSGGGYGDPLDRDPARVLEDVLEGYETEDRALNVYAVVFERSLDGTLTVDYAATRSERESRASG